MSTKKMLGLMLMCVMVGGILFAETPKADTSEVKIKEQSQEVQRPQPPLSPIGRGGAMPEDREQLYRERMAKQTEAHKASLKELEDIKKIAEEEGAVKTAEALQKLIDRKDAEFKEKLAQFERARKERAVQLLEKVKKDAPEAIKPESKEAGKKPADPTSEK